MGDHTLSIAEVTPPGPWSVGDEVRVKLKVSPSLRVGQTAKVTVRCAAWDTAEVSANVRSTHVVKARFTRTGPVEMRLARVQGAITGTSIHAGEVRAAPTVAFAPEPIPDLCQAPGVAHGIKLGTQNLRLAVQGSIPHGGASVRLTSAAFKQPAVANLRPNDPSPLAQVQVVFMDPPRPTEVVLEAVEGCELEGGAARLTTTVVPTAPTVRLEHAAQDGPTKEHAAGGVVDLKLVFSYAPVPACELRLSAPQLKGGKHDAKLSRGGAATTPLQVKLADTLEEGTATLRLERRSGDVVIDDGGRSVEVKVAPPLTVSFPPSGWITPESKKGYTVDETVRFVARLDRPAPAAGAYAQLVVGGDAPRDLSWDEGTQDSKPLSVTLTTFDTKTKVKLQVTDPVRLGSAAEHTIAVHQANRVMLSKKGVKHASGRKPPYYPGDALTIPVRLKYALVLTEDQAQQGERRVQVATLSCPAFEADVPVFVDEGGRDVEVEATVKEGAPAGQQVITLTPTQGFRAKGKEGAATETTKVEIGAARALEPTGRPAVVGPGGREVEVDHVYLGEPVRLRFRASSPPAADVVAGTVVITFGGRRGQADLHFAAGEQEGIATWDGTFTGTGTETEGELTITITPAAGFTAKQERKKGKLGEKDTLEDRTLRTLEVRALPHLGFASAPWPVKDGAAAPTQALGAWVLADGEKRTLRLTLDPPDARPHALGVQAAVQCAAFTTSPAALPGLTLDTWTRTGASHQDVDVQAKAPTPPGAVAATIVNLQRARQAPAPAPGATGAAVTPSLSVRVDATPVIGFAAEGWLVRDPSAGDGPLRLNEQVTVVLDLLGGKPAQRWEGHLTSAALSAPVSVVFDPADPNADATWSARRLEVPLTFDKQAPTSTTLTLLFGPYTAAPPPPPPPQKPPPPPAPLTTYAGVKRGTSSRPLSFLKALDVQFEQHPDDGTPWVKAAPPATNVGPFLPGDKVVVRVSLSDEPPQGVASPFTVAKLKSFAFPPPPQPRGRKGAPAEPLPGTTPATFTPVPGEKAYDVEFVIQKSPLEPVDWDVELVEDGGSPYRPVSGERARLKLRVRPLPALSIAPEQPCFTEVAPPTAPRI